MPGNMVYQSGRNSLLGNRILLEELCMEIALNLASKTWDLKKYFISLSYLVNFMYVNLKNVPSSI